MLLTAFRFPEELIPLTDKRRYRWVVWSSMDKPADERNALMRIDDSGMTAVEKQKPPGEPPEKTILQRMAEGDATAVKDCFDRYGKLVWSVVYRFCPVPGDREDAVQEVFLEVWRSASRYQKRIASEGTFITMIARRRMIDRLRKHQRQPGLTDIDDVAETNFEIPAAGEGSAELVNVNRALSVLTVDQQKVIRLSVLQGYSHGEIADKTGIPVGTVKTHIRRGLMRVRDQLRDMRGSDKGVVYE